MNRKGIIILLVSLIVIALGGVVVFEMQEASKELRFANDEHSKQMGLSKQLASLPIGDSAEQGLIDQAKASLALELKHLNNVLNNPLASGDQKELAKLLIDVNTGNGRMLMYQEEMIKAYKAGNMDMALGYLNKASEEVKVVTAAANARDSFLASHDMGISVVKS